MECYLDNSATTRVLPEAAELMNKIFLEDYGNPSSLHNKGFDAEKYIRSARDSFASFLKCGKNDIIFTSGGTESNNTAILGAAIHYGSRGHHMITTRIEHAAVSEPMKFLESKGWQIDYLDVDSTGRVSLDQLKELLRKDTVLVSVMHVNNEIGTIQPIAEIGELIHNTAPDCLFHVDDIQGFGKLPLIPSKLHIDLLSASSHKIHGPKGVGLLYVSPRTHISPIIFGGGHQNGMRSGTENVPGVAGFALAASEMYKHMDENHKHFEELHEYFVSEISQLEDVTINGSKEFGAPYIISLTVKNVRAEVLLHALEDKGIYVSAGSACSSNKPSISATLKAIDVPRYALDSTVRLSFSAHTTMEELEYAINALKELVPTLRKFTRK
ncbi:cysteine desulfurase [Lachnospiraceae bacterium KH1T2]|nr:cysteine desulfurase [Lachnospiraceae bacterium KH1T2]